MANQKVRLNLKGINQVMTSREATAVVVREAKRIQQAAGANFEVNVVPHRYTARAYVRAANAKGAIAEAKDKVLTKAIGAPTGALPAAPKVGDKRADGRTLYVTSSGKKIWATDKQILHYLRNYG